MLATLRVSSRVRSKTSGTLLPKSRRRTSFFFFIFQTSLPNGLTFVPGSLNRSRRECNVRVYCFSARAPRRIDDRERRPGNPKFQRALSFTLSASDFFSQKRESMKKRHSIPAADNNRKSSERRGPMKRRLHCNVITIPSMTSSRNRAAAKRFSRRLISLTPKHPRRLSFAVFPRTRSRVSRSASLARKI